MVGEGDNPENEKPPYQPILLLKTHPSHLKDFEEHFVCQCLLWRSAYCLAPLRFLSGIGFGGRRDLGLSLESSVDSRVYRYIWCLLPTCTSYWRVTWLEQHIECLRPCYFLTIPFVLYYQNDFWRNIINAMFINKDKQCKKNCILKGPLMQKAKSASCLLFSTAFLFPYFIGPLPLDWHLMSDIWHITSFSWHLTLEICHLACGSGHLAFYIAPGNWHWTYVILHRTPDLWYLISAILYQQTFKMYFFTQPWFYAWKLF